MIVTSWDCCGIWRTIYHSDTRDFSLVVDVKGYLFDENVIISPFLFLLLFFAVMRETHQFNGLGSEAHHSEGIHPAGPHKQRRPKTTQLLFAIFLLIYSVTLVGNLGLIDVIHTSATLHTPMYFLLGVLSFLDICSASVFTPRLLINFVTTDQSISFVGCVVQTAVMILRGTRECLLLAMMAYDRFVAICPPLLYHTIMSKHLCVRLVVVTYAAGVFISAVQTGNAFILPYCGPNIIDHYFCDIPAMLQPACSETTMANVILLIFSALVTVPTISVISVSNAYIPVTICRMRSLEAQRKALSTCASHLTAPSLFYGSVFLVYVQPSPETASACNKILSVFYTIVFPMLNPLVCSLKNKDVKASAQALYRLDDAHPHWILNTVHTPHQCHRPRFILTLSGTSEKLASPKKLRLFILGIKRALAAGISDVVMQNRIFILLFCGSSIVHQYFCDLCLSA
ncbi:LOW QUALITY PROTEIN: olfactory receptor 1052-like [Neophocaena asiaeorientalis asiaeorientalis]|uniref:LOW QUALITY PROTEIN: olfactory receptor 1052-like n=1 Tax=Neophocaena asiaeorientalis asiaeorientalis TaxID=1706337 RepID=A0A341BR85_NEOAA|nr:LOW QUALITY PROTEIN: olfactory receptor 1052-like [Neophocaena asiaeorientalis asiaeorientalis]